MSGFFSDSCPKWNSTPPLKYAIAVEEFLPPSRISAGNGICSTPFCDWWMPRARFKITSGENSLFQGISRKFGISVTSRSLLHNKLSNPRLVTEMPNEVSDVATGNSLHFVTAPNS
jgi:hypothetical protein